MVKDILFFMFRCVGFFAKKDAHVNFVTDPLEGLSMLKLSDVLLFRNV